MSMRRLFVSPVVTALAVKAQHVRQVHPGSSEIMVLQQANDPEEIPNESPW